MTLLQKILLALATLSALTIIVRRAMTYERATLDTIEDAEPQQPEPLPSRKLRVAQNSPL
jgi:hypothetical protein